MFTSFTISHKHESSIVAESNAEYTRLSVPQKCTLISHSSSSKKFHNLQSFLFSQHTSWSSYFLWLYRVIWVFSFICIIYFWLFLFHVFQSAIILHSYIFFWSLLFIVIIWYFYQVVFIYFNFQDVTSVSSVRSSILSLQNITSWFICFF